MVEKISFRHLFPAGQLSSQISTYQKTRLLTSKRCPAYEPSGCHAQRQPGHFGDFGLEQHLEHFALEPLGSFERHPGPLLDTRRAYTHLPLRLLLDVLHSRHQHRRQHDPLRQRFNAPFPEIFYDPSRTIRRRVPRLRHLPVENPGIGWCL